MNNYYLFNCYGVTGVIDNTLFTIHSQTQIETLMLTSTSTKDSNEMFKMVILVYQSNTAEILSKIFHECEVFCLLFSVLYSTSLLRSQGKGCPLQKHHTEQSHAKWEYKLLYNFFILGGYSLPLVLMLFTVYHISRHTAGISPTVRWCLWPLKIRNLKSSTVFL